MLKKPKHHRSRASLMYTQLLVTVKAEAVEVSWEEVCRKMYLVCASVLFGYLITLCNLPKAMYEASRPDPAIHPEVSYFFSSSLHLNAFLRTPTVGLSSVIATCQTED